MSTTTLSTLRGLFNNRIGDIIVSGTTSDDGDADFTTAVDTALGGYDDDRFNDRYLYMTAAIESRLIKGFMSPSGTIKVQPAFTAQVAASKAYEIHLYDPAHKLIAINQALYDVFPYFYKRLCDTTLYGQNSYGVDPNEFNKFTYTVPSTFAYFPDKIWLHEGYIGTHTGSDDASALTDSTQSWETSELVGLTVYNKTDGSTGTVTANTSTAVTATLSGGTESDWDADDEYIIQKPNKKPILFTNYKNIDPAYATGFTFYADIDEKYLITLMGRAQLSQLTTDSSETELTAEQADVVATKAASNFCRMYSSILDAQESGRADSLVARFDAEFEDKVNKRRMPIIKNGMSIDWSWSK